MRIILSIFAIIIISCTQATINNNKDDFQPNDISKNYNAVEVGLDVLFQEKINIINRKKIGLVTNHSGVDKYGKPNYLKFIDQKNIDLKIIFSPEHGLFGEGAAGQKLEYSQIENMPKIVSLYGKNKKPNLKDLEEIDLIIYDVQDVGARFYTYITTLGYIMEAAAKTNIKVVILDRPNPINGNVIEGPVLNIQNQSFVGNYPIPIRYGLTIGELAKMIIGEKWINSFPDLIVIPAKNWSRKMWYDETGLNWTKPSPNIPNINTALIYPGLCLLEATNINEGRGTKKPFKRFGAPWINNRALATKLNEKNLPGVEFKAVTYIPTDIDGVAMNPKYKNQICNGVEIIVKDRNRYQSVKTGIAIISQIASDYPNLFEISEKRMKKLWGINDLSIFKNINNNAIDRSSIKDFLALSKKYYIYD